MAPNEKPSMILVMGVTGAGKSYFINRLAGREAVKEGVSLASCTTSCEAVPIKIGNKIVYLVDTPGFDDADRTDAEILAEIATCLAGQYRLDMTLSGAIYLHRVTDVRYTRSAIKTLQIFQRICGDEAMMNVLLVTTRWNEVDGRLGAGRERELKDRIWKYMIAKGSTVCRYYGDRDSAMGIASQLLCKRSIILDLQKELVDEHKPLNETEAGSFVDKSLDEAKAGYRQDLAALERLKKDLLESDREMRRQIQVDMEAEQEKIERTVREQSFLRQRIGATVEEDIQSELSEDPKKKKKKNGAWKKVLPLIPTAIGLIGLFVGIPIGSWEQIGDWFQ